MTNSTEHEPNAELIWTGYNCDIALVISSGMTEEESMDLDDSLRDGRARSSAWLSPEEALELAAKITAAAKRVSAAPRSI